MIQIEVVHADALSFPAEVLALKYAQYPFGVDEMVASRLKAAGIDIESKLPAIGSVLLVRSESAIAAHEVLFLGLRPLGQFDYSTIRDFAPSVLWNLAIQRPSTKHLALTMHGVGFGLDEAEAFRSETDGLLDALAVGQQSQGLTRISIVERNPHAAQRLATLLREILPLGIVEGHRSLIGSAPNALREARVSLGEVGRDFRQKAHVFVSMPFSEEYADGFHYGISGRLEKLVICASAQISLHSLAMSSRG